MVDGGITVTNRVREYAGVKAASPSPTPVAPKPATPAKSVDSASKARASPRPTTSGASSSGSQNFRQGLGAGGAAGEYVPSRFAPHGPAGGGQVDVPAGNNRRAGGPAAVGGVDVAHEQVPGRGAPAPGPAAVPPQQQIPQSAAGEEGEDPILPKNLGEAFERSVGAGSGGSRGGSDDTYSSGDQARGGEALPVPLSKDASSLSSPSPTATARSNLTPHSHASSSLSNDVEYNRAALPPPGAGAGAGAGGGSAEGAGGSTVRREVVMRLRGQLKSREEMILEMQARLTEQERALERQVARADDLEALAARSRVARSELEKKNQELLKALKRLIDARERDAAIAAAAAAEAAEARGDGERAVEDSVVQQALYLERVRVLQAERDTLRGQDREQERERERERERQVARFEEERERMLGEIAALKAQLAAQANKRNQARAQAQAQAQSCATCQGRDQLATSGASSSHSASSGGGSSGGGGGHVATDGAYLANGRAGGGLGVRAAERRENGAPVEVSEEEDGDAHNSSVPPGGGGSAILPGQGPMGQDVAGDSPLLASGDEWQPVRRAEGGAPPSGIDGMRVYANPLSEMTWRNAAASSSVPTGLATANGTTMAEHPLLGNVGGGGSGWVGAASGEEEEEEEEEEAGEEAEEGEHDELVNDLQRKFDEDGGDVDGYEYSLRRSGGDGGSEEEEEEEEEEGEEVEGACKSLSQQSGSRTSSHRVNKDVEFFERQEARISLLKARVARHLASSRSHVSGGGSPAASGSSANNAGGAPPSSDAGSELSRKLAAQEDEAQRTSAEVRQLSAALQLSSPYVPHSRKEELRKVLMELSPQSSAQSSSPYQLATFSYPLPRQLAAGGSPSKNNGVSASFSPHLQGEGWGGGAGTPSGFDGLEEASPAGGAHKQEGKPAARVNGEAPDGGSGVKAAGQQIGRQPLSGGPVRQPSMGQRAGAGGGARAFDIGGKGGERRAQRDEEEEVVEEVEVEEEEEEENNGEALLRRKQQQQQQQSGRRRKRGKEEEEVAARGTDGSEGGGDFPAARPVADAEADLDDLVEAVVAEIGGAAEIGGGGRAAETGGGAANTGVGAAEVEGGEAGEAEIGGGQRGAAEIEGGEEGPAEIRGEEEGGSGVGGEGERGEEDDALDVLLDDLMDDMHRICSVENTPVKTRRL
eukprot:jgi/Mesen1/2366/ME000156S01511